MSSPRKRPIENANSAHETSKRRRVDETYNSTNLSTGYPTPSTPSNLTRNTIPGGNESPLKAINTWKLDESTVCIPETSLTLPEEDEVVPQRRWTKNPTVPIRRLRDFIIRSLTTREKVSLDYVLEKDKSSNDPDMTMAYFSGIITPMNGKQSSSSDTPRSYSIVSSVIRYIWQCNDYEGEGDVDRRKIWIQTDFAWYILEQPDPSYISFYFDRWLQHQVWISISKISKQPSPSIQLLMTELNESVKARAKRKFQRRISSKSVSVFIPCILQTISETAREDNEDSEYCVKLMETVLFRLLCTQYADHLLDFVAGEDEFSIEEHPLPSSPRKLSNARSHSKPKAGLGLGFRVEPQPKSRVSSISRHPSPEIPSTGDPSTTRQEYPTFCTPLVRKLAHSYLPLLGIQEKGADDSSEDDDATQNAPATNRIQQNLMEIDLPRATSRVSWDTEGIAESQGLRWVEVGGQRFQPNDTVYVYTDNERGHSFHIRPADIPKHIYIAFILNLYLDKFERPKAHIIYFEPAPDTSLGNLEEKEDNLVASLAHPQELLLSDDCEDVFATQFFGLCDNRYLAPGSLEPPPEEGSVSYFYRYFWISDNDDAFIDAQSFLEQSLAMGRSKSCPRCWEKDTINRTEVTQDGLTIGNTEYHINDFVYIQHEQSNRPYIIGQILRIYKIQNKIKVQYRRYHRPKPTYEQPRDDRLLTFDDSDPQYSIDVNRLEGKCFVLPFLEDNSESYRLPDDTFICKLPPSVSLCHQCGFPDIPSEISPLKGLDLFSGAGGLSIGLESTGIVETRWAVERDESAAMTFQKNHKQARVYNKCINQLLSQVYARERQSEQSDANNDIIEDFPRRGEVDIIFGGPPCQGFTRLNRQKQPKDQRNQLILSFMSAVDILRPKYVLIENVKVMLSFPVGAISDGGQAFDGGIKRGFVKLVKRLLTGMDYQVRYGILHSGQYGVPQARRRVIFLAARRGLKLPDLPQPTHVTFSRLDLRVTVSEHTGGEDRSFTVSRRKNNNAPLGIVTVGDAISDLHRWEWRRPNLSEIPENEQKMHAARIIENNIEVLDHKDRPFNVKLHVSGPTDPVPYSRGPMSNYQRMLRENRVSVTQHWSPTFHEEEIKRICSIPFESKRDPNRIPDHNDLPPEQRRASIYGKREYDGRYGRLHNDDYFDVSVGKLGPNTDMGRVIHPDLHRILTIREAARSQGFPDRVEFECVGNSVRHITQQIGNSVPPPMAAAIGREIRKARLEDVKEDDREESVSL